METVLETYGGPEDKWVNTFGAPREVAAANSVSSGITYDGSRDALLETDKAVNFVLDGSIPETRNTNHETRNTKPAASPRDLYYQVEEIPSKQ